jgi:hypothetical protein
MAYEPTKTATAGKFQSRGEDLVQYIDNKGDVMVGMSADGTMFAKDIVANGVSLSALATEVQQIVISGLPSDIDLGTF